MGRRASVDDDELLGRLMGVFRAVGYEGATLAMLAEKAGLQKASLYHRFPGGKEQMAREVLQAAEDWLGAHVLTPLSGDAPARERLARMATTLDAFYAGGERACLLNTMSTMGDERGPFADAIARMFEAWIAAMARVVSDSGVSAGDARARAERALALLQGALVLSRGMGTTRPFCAFLKSLPSELLGS